MKRFFLKPFKKLSSGRPLNIKRVIFFPLIVYAAYLLLDSFMPLFMVGFVIGCSITGLVEGGFGDEALFTTRPNRCASQYLKAIFKIQSRLCRLIKSYS